MTENLNGMTIGRLKEIISNIDDNVEIGIWDHLGLVTSIEIEVMIFLKKPMLTLILMEFIHIRKEIRK